MKIPPLRPRMNNDEIKARLILIVGITLSVTFFLSTAALLYGLLFVTQPLEVSDNDKSAWSLLSPMMMFLTGSLAGVLASNGLKHQKDNNDNSKTSTEN
jgi:hypothetical protein